MNKLQKLRASFSQATSSCPGAECVGAWIDDHSPELFEMASLAQALETVLLLIDPAATITIEAMASHHPLARRWFIRIEGDLTGVTMDRASGRSLLEALEALRYSIRATDSSGH